MATKKEDKIILKQFSDKSSHFWVGTLHYSLNEQNEIIWHAGGIDSEEYRTILKNFIKRNKKTYQERIIMSHIEYNEVIPFGKYFNKTVSQVFEEDKSYLIWMKDKYDFGGNIKLKEQIIEILK